MGLRSGFEVTGAILIPGTLARNLEAINPKGNYSIKTVSKATCGLLIHSVLQLRASLLHLLCLA